MSRTLAHLPARFRSAMTLHRSWLFPLNWHPGGREIPCSPPLSLSFDLQPPLSLVAPYQRGHLTVWLWPPGTPFSNLAKSLRMEGNP